MSGNSPAGTDAAVLAIWRDVLGVDDIRTEDTFTELGGSSLQIVEVRDAIEQRLGVRLSIADLAGAATSSALAAHVEACARREFGTRTTGAVRIGSPAPLGSTVRTVGAVRTGSPEDSGRVQAAGVARTVDSASADSGVQRAADTADVNLFCLPGSGGSSWSFVPLANRMPESVAVYSVCQRGLEQRGRPHFRMRSLVRYAVREIRAVQSSGPYYLLGHSMGGVAALEVANELERQGDSVALVILLDATLPAATAVRMGLPSRPPGADAAPVRSLPSRIALHTAMLTAGSARHDIGRRQELFYEIGLRVQNRHQLRRNPRRVFAVLTPETAHSLPGWRVLLGDFPTVEARGSHMDVVRDGPVLWEVAVRVGAAISHRE